VREHAGHLIATVVMTAGLFLAARVADRKPASRVARSRREWERSLFGLPSRDGVAVLVARAEMRIERRKDPTATVAVLSILAGAIHLAALPEHVRESLLFGAFFVLSGAFQIATGWALRTVRSRGLLALVAAVNAGIVGLWILSRTKGVPLGPEPWVAERTGPLDVVASACEVAIVAGVVWIRSLQRSRAAS
jgi:hypothetical protein